MMWVRWPSGSVEQFNTAVNAETIGNFTYLYESTGKGWIAKVPNTCAFEVVRPCRVFYDDNRDGGREDERVALRQSIVRLQTRLKLTTARLREERGNKARTR